MSYTISTAAEKLGLTKHYVRKCIREDKLEAELVQHPTREGIERYEISEEELERFANRPSRGFGQREDGRNKFVVYYTEDELEQVESVLEELGFSGDTIPSRANPPKNS